MLDKFRIIHSTIADDGAVIRVMETTDEFSQYDYIISISSKDDSITAIAVIGSEWHEKYFIHKNNEWMDCWEHDILKEFSTASYLEFAHLIIKWQKDVQTSYEQIRSFELDLIMNGDPVAR